MMVSVGLGQRWVGTGTIGRTVPVDLSWFPYHSGSLARRWQQPSCVSSCLFVELALAKCGHNVKGIFVLVSVTKPWILTRKPHISDQSPFNIGLTLALALPSAALDSTRLPDRCVIN